MVGDDALEFGSADFAADAVRNRDEHRRFNDRADFDRGVMRDVADGAGGVACAGVMMDESGGGGEEEQSEDGETDGE